ncbi:MAG: F0F1 ATP synthase subunit delta [Lactobacillaceae bacterium]|jgi:F-type H+-transporting ATPase subunit delta|nr:F0F1 ATP synthase subunit delta [Lactobacillaceae bacterium]
MAINDNRIVNNYARAIFDVSGKDTPTVLAELIEIEKVFESNKKLASTLDDVSVTSREQKEFIKTISNGTNKITKNFLLTIADNRHFYLVEKITNKLNELVNKSNHQSIVTAITAVSLTKTQITKIKTIAKNKFNLEHVELKNEIDPTIIGGVVLRSGSKTIDGSIKNKISKIEYQIKTDKERSN